MTNKFVRGALASLESFVITILHTPDLTRGTMVTELGHLNKMELVESQGGRGQWQHSVTKET